MSAARLLIVDDDRELAAMLAEFLQLEGFEVRLCHRPPSAAEWAELRGAIDLAILDVMLPQRSGFDVLREWRSSADPAAQVPVLMLTARGDAVDRILGLELGADDYLAKPFDPRELAARARAILRRSHAARIETRGSDARIVRGPLVIDLARRRAELEGRALDLTGAELRLLQRLAESPGAPVDRAALSEFALGRPLTAYDRSVDTHVSNLRRKLALAGSSRAVELRSVRGLGYELLVAPELP